MLKTHVLRSQDLGKTGSRRTVFNPGPLATTSLAFDSGQENAFHEHRLSDGFSVTGFHSPLSTRVCQSVRGDPHSSSASDVVNLPEGRGMK